VDLGRRFSPEDLSSQRSCKAPDRRPRWWRSSRLRTASTPAANSAWFQPPLRYCAASACVSVYALARCVLARQGNARGDVREGRPIVLIPYLSVGLLAFLVVVFAYCSGREPSGHPQMASKAALTCFVFPAIGVVAALVAARKRSAVAGTECRFYMVAPLIFAAAIRHPWRSRFGLNMVPFSITIEEAAAPHSVSPSCSGGRVLFVFPLICCSNTVRQLPPSFRGKVRLRVDHY